MNVALCYYFLIKTLGGVINCWVLYCSKAIKDLSTGLSIENTNIECLYLRASCYHALGEYGHAVLEVVSLVCLEYQLHV